MKYLTSQLTMENKKLHLEPLYFPSVSLGETLILRIICGNIKPTMMEVMIEGDTLSNRLLMVQRMPTVYEAKLSREFFKDVLSEEPKKFRLNIFVKIGEMKYTVVSDELIYIQGQSFDVDHLTDVSDLYDRLNAIKDELHSRL